MKQTLKKGFTIATAVMTATWSIGIAAFAPLSAAAAPSAAASTGDLVKASLAAVYYIGDNGKRYVFPNQKTYNTWWDNFSSVMTITDSELASIAIGGNATYRPGARLVKITTDPKVYMVGAGAALHAIASEATAMELFGSDWNTKIDDVPDAFFTNYTVASGTVDVAAIGAGGLPTGTIGMYNGDYITTSSTGRHMVTGVNSNLIKALVMVDTSSERDSWFGATEGASQDMNDVATPDRSGVLEGGSGLPDDSVEGLSVEVTKKSTQLSMASGQSQNVGTAEVELCADGGSHTIESLHVSTGSGTVGPDTLLGWFQFGDYIYDENGNDDIVVEYTATDGEFTVPADSCVKGYYHVATNTTSGRQILDLKAVTTTGTSTAGVLDLNMRLVDRDAVAVASADLLDVTFSNITPAGGTTLQTDGTKQKVFGIQVNTSNHDMYVPNVVFRVTGSLETSNCELRVNGTAVSTNYKWINERFIVFEIPESARLFDEGSDTWELWCDIDGEAGQTVTPQLVWPAPYFWFYDAERTAVGSAVAGMNTGMEQVAPSITKMTNSVTSALNLAGASATIEIVNINNVTSSAGQLQDDEKTIGVTKSVDLVAKVKIRGDTATLNTLTLIMAGTDAATGLANCQIKIGQRTDKGEFSASAVNLGDFNLSNFGGQQAVANANVAFTATKKMAVGDWLFVVECDHTTALTNGNTLTVSLVAGAANLTFDVGTTANFPAALTAGTTLTSRNLGNLTTAADLTGRNLIQNGDNQVIGVFTITGFTHEGAKITSIGVTFAAGVSGTAGCTTVTLTNSSGDELATSQSLNAAGTLTFSVDVTVDKNVQYVVKVVCVQASSGVTPATVAGATTLATLSGNGVLSNQAFNATPGTAGASVTVATSGSLVANQATNQPARTIGPNKELKVLEYSVTASILEGQEISSLVFTFTDPAAAVASDLASIRVTADGFTVNGAASAAPVDVCTRVVTGLVLTCSFSSNEVQLAAGGTGTISLYTTGNSFGNIAVAGGAVTDILTATVAAAATDINFKGDESEAAIVPAAATFTGRAVLPQASEAYLVKKALPSTLQAGQTDMVLWVGDFVVSGSTFNLTDLVFTCTGTNSGTDTCVAGGLNDLEIDSTIVATTTTTDGAFDAASTGLALPAAGVSLTVGTHPFQIYSDQSVCSTGDTVQLNLTDIAWTTNDGTNTDTIAVGVAGQTYFQPFNSAASNILTGTSNLCG